MTAHRDKNAQPNVARNILKKRDKPYKVEKSVIVAKRRKLEIQNKDEIQNTAGHALVPNGFKFLPIGIPELSNRCKELSRVKNLPVDAVNTKPLSQFGEDPGKISYYVRRLGYHFRSEVVDEACRELGYTFHKGKFLKAPSLAEEFQRDRIGATLAKHGVRVCIQPKKETHDQIRAAIKELFPNIPDDDLEEVIKVAWDETENRVGTNKTISLPRRVQLATLARIRHVYTDYDSLLKAFHDWPDARATVEPICIQKLKEWRGENDDQPDDELEEIIRETIVIDDDDDDDAVQYVSDADDEDSVILVDSMSTRDSSPEITYTRMNNDELRPESVIQPDHQLPYPFSVRPQYVNPDNRVYTQSTYPRGAPNTVVFARSGYNKPQLAVPMQDRGGLRPLVDERSHEHGSIIVDGRLYRKIGPRSHADHRQPTKVTHPYTYPTATSLPAPSPLSTAQNPSHDRAIQSIEPLDDPHNKNVRHSTSTVWENASAAPVQFLPRARSNYANVAPARLLLRQPQDHQPVFGSREQRVVYTPLHGEPALVQQMPRVSTRFGQVTPITKYRS